MPATKVKTYMRNPNARKHRSHRSKKGRRFPKNKESDYKYRRHIRILKKIKNMLY